MVHGDLLPFAVLSMRCDGGVVRLCWLRIDEPGCVGTAGPDPKPHSVREFRILVLWQQRPVSRLADPDLVGTSCEGALGCWSCGSMSCEWQSLVGTFCDVLGVACWKPVRALQLGQSVDELLLRMCGSWEVLAAPGGFAKGG
jgi:hypothetical protein